MSDFIEGPPAISPGDSARVVVEIESDRMRLSTGTEFDLLELDTKTVGYLTRGATPPGLTLSKRHGDVASIEFWRPECVEPGPDYPADCDHLTREVEKAGQAPTAKH